MGTQRPHRVTPAKNHADNRPVDILCTELLIKTWSWTHAVPSAMNTVLSSSEALTLEWRDYASNVTKHYVTQNPLLRGHGEKMSQFLAPEKAVHILGTWFVFILWTLWLRTAHLIMLPLCFQFWEAECQICCSLPRAFRPNLPPRHYFSFFPLFSVCLISSFT